MDAARLEKLFEPFAVVTVKGMFGGRGVSAEGLMFALQAGDKIYLKTDALSAPRFKEAGSTPFVFRSPMGPKETSYWLIPAAAGSDAKAFKTWCGLALDAARRAAAAKEAKEGGRSKRAAAKSGPAKRAASGPTGHRPPSRKGRAR
jgi:DNA transformation protein